MRSDVTKLTWAELNAQLVACTDERQLKVWLDQLIKHGGPKHRAVRIHGRLCKVRRMNELKQIKTSCQKDAA